MIRPLTALKPICANITTWDQSSTGSHRLANFSGGPEEDMIKTVMCPNFMFLTGLSVFSGGSVEGVTPICSAFRYYNE